MTLTIAPETETRLKAVAEGQGLDMTELHAEILARGLEEAEARMRADTAMELQDTLAGLDRSVADVAAGRWMTSEEFSRRMEAKAADLRTKRHAAAGTQ